jgi:uncharacterized membrane protein YesL
MPAKAAFPVILDSIKIWWKDWANQVLVSLAAILLSLTIVLYPAALFGVYEQALDLSHGIRTGIMGFWQGFKCYWRKSLLWGLLNLLVLAILSFNVWFYLNIDHPIALVLIVLMFGLIFFWLVWQFYAVSCFFLQEEKNLKIAWKNGLAVILLQPGYAFVIAIMMLILLGLSITTFIPFFLGSVPLIAILGLQAVQVTIKQDEA